MATLAPTFLIGPFSFFQVTRTTIKSGQSSNLGHIGLRSAELAALSESKNSHRLIMGEMLWPLQRIHFSLNLLHYSLALKKWGYIGLALSFRYSVIL